MEFRDGMRILGERITQQDVARRLGLSYHTVRQAVLPAGAGGARGAPAHWEWETVLAEMARERAAALTQLAQDLEAQSLE